MKSHLAIQVKKKVNTIPVSTFSQHTAMHPVADHTNQPELASTLNETRFGHDFSQIVVQAASDAARSDLSAFCSLTPKRCPYGGACHTCPVRVQTKLAVNQPGDEYEQEADHVSEMVMRMPAPINDEEDKCQQPGCAKKLQRKTDNEMTPDKVPPIVQEVLLSPGQPLDPVTRAYMEPRFGHDFSQVRVHTDAKASESVRAVNALAYTVGRDVVFGYGQYAPNLDAGRKLMAHELAHVIQQKTSDGLYLDRANAPDFQERQFWLDLGKQPNYGVLPKEKRTPMASKTGNQLADEILWAADALLTRADQMRIFLQNHFGVDKDLRLTSVIKPGEHIAYCKMDVVRVGTTTWEELAAAAVHAGFWVHAEGVTLGKKLWPLSPKATGPHLDLYLIKKQAGDFPMPTNIPMEGRYASDEFTQHGFYET